MMDKPNVLWICTDQQRADTLGCYGNSFVRTPNLDALARGGVMLAGMHAQSPVCGMTFENIKGVIRGRPFDMAYATDVSFGRIEIGEEK